MLITSISAFVSSSPLALTVYTIYNPLNSQLRNQTVKTANQVVHHVHGHRAEATKCKILLPKFNTWEQVQIERKNGSRLPFYNASGGFSAKSLCHSSQMASPLQCNRDAVTVQSRCRYGVTALRLHCNGDAVWQFSWRLKTVKSITHWYSRTYQNYPKFAFFRPSDGLVEKKRFSDDHL